MEVVSAAAAGVEWAWRHPPRLRGRRAGGADGAMRCLRHCKGRRRRRYVGVHTYGGRGGRSMPRN